MATQKKKPVDYQTWIDARKRYHLSHTHIQMARELGMDPAKFSNFDNYKKEPWKSSLPVFIEEIYLQRFNKRHPDDVQPLEQIVKNRIISELMK